jgi:hypothetical protein
VGNSFERRCRQHDVRPTCRRRTLRRVLSELWYITEHYWYYKVPKVHQLNWLLCLPRDKKSNFGTPILPILGIISGRTGTQDTYLGVEVGDVGKLVLKRRCRQHRVHCNK